MSDKIKVTPMEMLFCMSNTIDWLYDTSMYYTVQKLETMKHLFKSNYICKMIKSIESNRKNYQSWFTKYFDTDVLYQHAEINEFYDDEIMPLVNKFANTIKDELGDAKYASDIAYLEAYRCLAATADVLIESYMVAFPEIEDISLLKSMRFPKAQNMIDSVLVYIGQCIGKECAKTDLNSSKVLSGFAELRDKLINVETFVSSLKVAMECKTN